MKNSQVKYGKFLAVFLSFLSTITIVSHSSLADEKNNWGYEGANNPTQWGKITPEFATCQLGRDQSPVDLSYSEEESTATKKIKFNYQPSEVAIIDSGHAIQVNVNSDNKIEIDSDEYKLLQFHFHTPSEHTVDNKSSAMELHLVHQNDRGQLAVVGILMEEGAENSLIDRIWQNIPDGDRKIRKDSLELDPAELLPKDKTFISYGGSLTTPPCSEEVSWNLLLEPIEVSAAQIRVFASLYPYNARPIQPLNGRPIILNRDK